MIKLSELCLAADGSAICPYDDFIIKNIVTDSRKVKAGDVFFALKGEKFDGHDFCQIAVENGAHAIVVDRLMLPLPDGAAVIKVADTLQAYQDVAAYWRLAFDIPVIAVTGSTGKTTTKDIIASALSVSMKTLKSQANFNNEIGVPATLLHLSQTHQVAVIEMGMRGAGQIRQLAEIAKPTMGVVTNVGKTHMELLGSVDNIAGAKRELVEALDENSIAFLNCDDKHVKAMAEVAKGRVILFGCGEEAHFKAENITIKDTETVFTCLDKVTDAAYEVSLPLLGRHNVYNALSAIAVATLLGVPREDMLRGLKRVELSAMRQHIEREFGMTFVDDTYNANPDSMKAALELLQGLPGQRKIAVLGDMLELGSVAHAEHEALGVLACSAGVDLLITIGSKSSRASIKAGECGMRTWHFANQTLAADAIIELLEKGDTVLFKGSRGMRLDELLVSVKERLRRKNEEISGENKIK